MYKFVLCKYLCLRSMETTRNWFSLNADKYQILGVSSKWVAVCPQAWMFAVKKERDNWCVSLHRQNLCGKNSPPIGSEPLTTVCESQKHEQGRVEGTHQCTIQTFPVIASSGWQRTHHGFLALNVPTTRTLLRTTQWSVILVSQRDRGRVFLSQRQWHGHTWDRCGQPMTVNIEADGLGKVSR